MYDSSDPLSGWSIKEVEATLIGPATSDIYGKLFHHVRCLLKLFLERLSSSSMTFRLHQVDASDLPSHQLERSFDRIEACPTAITIKLILTFDRYPISPTLRISVSIRLSP